MIDIPFVTEEQLEKATSMEKTVFEFPSSVVEFVGVRVEPTADDPIYHVTVGCHPSIDPKLISTATYMQLRSKWRLEKLNISAFRGVTRHHKSS